MRRALRTVGADADSVENPQRGRGERAGSQKVGVTHRLANCANPADVRLFSRDVREAATRNGRGVDEVDFEVGEAPGTGAFHEGTNPALHLGVRGVQGVEGLSPVETGIRGAILLGVEYQPVGVCRGQGRIGGDDEGSQPQAGTHPRPVNIGCKSRDVGEIAVGLPHADSLFPAVVNLHDAVAQVGGVGDFFRDDVLGDLLKPGVPA